jgi:hypothetical protein
LLSICLVPGASTMAALRPSGITGYVWYNLDGIGNLTLKEVAWRVAIKRRTVVVSTVAVVPSVLPLATATQIASTWGSVQESHGS